MIVVGCDVMFRAGNVLGREYTYVSVKCVGDRHTHLDKCIQTLTSRLIIKVIMERE